MSDTKITHPSQSPASLNEQTGDTASVQSPGVLSATHPNATVTQAHTPPLIDAPHTATSEEVETTLARLVHGQTNRGAQQKARNILRLIPEENKTPETLGALKQILDNNGEEVTNLLHLTKEQCADSKARLSIRSQVLYDLLATGDLQEAQAHRVLLLKREAVIQSVANIVTGSIKESAAQKARSIADLMNDGEIGVTGYNRLATLLENKPSDVKELLHQTDEDFKDRDTRMAMRAFVLSNLAQGATITGVYIAKNNYIEAEQCTNLLADALPAGAGLPQEASDQNKANAEAIIDELAAVSPGISMTNLHTALRDNKDGIKDILLMMSRYFGDDGQSVSNRAELLNDIAHPPKFTFIHEAAEYNHTRSLKNEFLKDIRDFKEIIGRGSHRSEDAHMQAIIEKMPDWARTRGRLHEIVATCKRPEVNIREALNRFDTDLAGASSIIRANAYAQLFTSLVTPPEVLASMRPQAAHPADLNAAMANDGDRGSLELAEEPTVIIHEQSGQVVEEEIPAADEVDAPQEQIDVVNSPTDGVGVEDDEPTSKQL